MSNFTRNGLAAKLSDLSSQICSTFDSTEFARLDFDRPTRSSCILLLSADQRVTGCKLAGLFFFHDALHDACRVNKL